MGEREKEQGSVGRTAVQSLMVITFIHTPETDLDPTAQLISSGPGCCVCLHPQGRLTEWPPAEAGQFHLWRLSI